MKNESGKFHRADDQLTWLSNFLRKNYPNYLEEGIPITDIVVKVIRGLEFEKKMAEAKLEFYRRHWRFSGKFPLTEGY